MWTHTRVSSSSATQQQAITDDWNRQRAPQVRRPYLPQRSMPLPTVLSSDVNGYVCVCVWPISFSQPRSPPNASEHFLFVHGRHVSTPITLPCLTPHSEKKKNKPGVAFRSHASIALHPRPARKHMFTSLPQNAYQPFLKLSDYDIISEHPNRKRLHQGHRNRNHKKK